MHNARDNGRICADKTMPSRRRLFAGLSATLLAGAAIATAAHGASVDAALAPDGADAELIALVSIMTRSQGILERMEDEPDYPDDSPEMEDYEQRIGKALDAYWNAADRVVKMAATTAAGMQAEAMRTALLRCVCVGAGETLNDIAEHEFEDQMAWSLARDLLAWSAAA